MKTTILRHVLLILFAIVLYSCANLPSASENEEVVKEAIKERSKDQIDLILFEKTNSLQRELFGVKVYLVYFIGQIKYKQDGYITANYRRLNILNFVQEKPKPNPFDMFLEVALKIDRNTVKNIKGEIPYIKTEKGWIIENNKIKITAN